LDQNKPPIGGYSETRVHSTNRTWAVPSIYVPKCKSKQESSLDNKPRGRMLAVTSPSGKIDAVA